MPVPRVSVILPTRNRAELLRRSVRSVLAQTFTDFELIVVDDGSTDHTQDVLWAFEDPRLRILRRDEPRSSAAAARNEAIRQARAAFLAFQDDDDYWLVTKLERQYDALSRASSEVGLCLSGYLRRYHEGMVYFGGPRLMSVFDYRGGFYFADRKVDYSLIATPGWLVRREALEKAGTFFDERFRSLDDWELGLRLSEVCRFVHVDEPLFVQDRTQGTGMVYNEPALAGDTRIIVEKHGHRWEKAPKVRARHAYVVGKITPQLTTTERRAWLWGAIRAYPLFAKAWAALALTYLSDRAMTRVTTQVRRLREAAKRSP